MQNGLQEIEQAHQNNEKVLPILFDSFSQLRTRNNSNNNNSKEQSAMLIFFSLFLYRETVTQNLLPTTRIIIITIMITITRIRSTNFLRKTDFITQNLPQVSRFNPSIQSNILNSLYPYQILTPLFLFFSHHPQKRVAQNHCYWKARACCVNWNGRTFETT